MEKVLLVVAGVIVLGLGALGAVVAVMAYAGDEASNGRRWSRR